MGAEKKYTVAELQSWAKIYGGKFLSKEYTGYKRTYEWRCEKGHTFDLTLRSLDQGAWCPACAKGDRTANALDLMQEWAKEKNGRCVSKEYIDNVTPLEWECEQGHRFKRTRDEIKYGRWCNACERMQFLETKLKEMKQLARTRGGQCLSEAYVDLKTKLLWKCRKGHEWPATPITVIYRQAWCPHCYGNVRFTIEKMQELALAKGGKCLSKTYTSVTSLLKWQCVKGHIWETKASNVLSGTWCPECGGSKKHTIAEAKALAKKKGGKCLSTVYINANSPLEWQCAKGHHWRTSFNWINAGSWCPHCYGKARLTIEKMHELALARAGKCLSKTYTNTKTPLKWQCAKGHQWDTPASNIIAGHWCPVCAGNNKYTISVMRKIAAKHKGKCLSDKYINTKTPLLWECKKGHQWKTTPHSILYSNTWCPECYDLRR